LNARLGEIATGVFHGMRHERVTFDELAADLLTDYRINGKRSLEKADRSVRHLKSCFGGMRALDVTTGRVKTYIRQRQEAGVSNGEINRELAALKEVWQRFALKWATFSLQPRSFNYLRLVSAEHGT
jgi:hypothetical protein